MAIIWHEPRKRASSSEPRVTISQHFLSLNKAFSDEYFSGVERVKLGYDPDNKKLILVPLEKDDMNGMKIIKNANSVSQYINAKRAFIRFNLTDEQDKVLPQFQGVYKCTRDKDNKRILVDFGSGKVK